MSTSSSNDSAVPPALTKAQYRTPDNLNARQRLHERFSTNPRGWFPWYLDQLNLPPDARILEVGCGPANLWTTNLDRLHKGWRMVLTDFSQGMVQTAWQNLADHSAQFVFCVDDAQAIPFPTACFDAVIANHMIYHIPDRAAGIGEMRRVLKPGGRLYAATNGEMHMQDLDALVRRQSPEIMEHVIPVSANIAAAFSLENGADQLKAFFSTVELRRYEDSLIVPEAQPLVDYVLSMTRFSDRVIPESTRQAFLSAVESEILTGGPVHIQKDAGLFIAS